MSTYPQFVTDMIKAGTLPPMLHKAITPVAPWMKEVPGRKERWEDLTKPMGLLNADGTLKGDAISNLRRRKFEMLADNMQDRYMQELVGNPHGRARLFSAMKEQLLNGGVINEASTINQTTANVNAQALAVLASLWRKTKIDMVVGVQPLAGPSSRIWYEKPQTKASFTDADGNVYSANTDVSAFSSGTFIKKFYQTTEAGTIPAIKPAISSYLIETDDYKIRYEFARERERDFQYYFGMSLADMTLADMVAILLRVMEYACTDGLISAVPGAHNANFDCEGYSDYTGSFEAYRDWESLLVKDIAKVEAMIQKDTGAVINVIAGSHQSLLPLKQGAAFQNTRMKWTDEALNDLQTGAAASMGSMFLGVFDQRYRVVQFKDWPDDTKILLTFKDMTNDFRVGGILGIREMGFITPQFLDDTDMTLSQALSDCWVFKVPDENVNYLGTITLSNAPSVG